MKIVANILLILLAIGLCIVYYEIGFRAGKEHAKNEVNWAYEEQYQCKKDKKSLHRELENAWQNNRMLRRKLNSCGEKK